MGKCSFNTAWLKDEIYSKWLNCTNKHAALCRVCERVILLTTMGTKGEFRKSASATHSREMRCGGYVRWFSSYRMDRQPLREVFLTILSYHTLDIRSLAVASRSRQSENLPII